MEAPTLSAERVSTSFDKSVCVWFFSSAEGQKLKPVRVLKLDCYTQSPSALNRCLLREDGLQVNTVHSICLLEEKKKPFLILVHRHRKKQDLYTVS